MSLRHTGRSLFAILTLVAISFQFAIADDFDAWNNYGFEESHITPDQPGFHAVERLGFTVGGDVISKLTRADGTVREISGGGLYQAGLGVLYRYPTIPFSLELTLNYHTDSDYNNNDNASFRRVPVETLLYFNGTSLFRIGAGMRFVYDARASSTINGVTEKYTFKNARGRIIEIGYQVRPYGWVNLRYVKEHYTVDTYTTTGETTPDLAGNVPYDGSHWGFFISYEY